MIRILNANSIRRFVHDAAEHHADAQNAKQKRDELDAQIRPLEEQLRALADQREEWSREYVNSNSMALDLVGVVQQVCHDNAWSLPSGLPTPDPVLQAQQPAELPVEREARAASTTTQANPLPPVEPDQPDTRPDDTVLCINACGRTLIVDHTGHGWVHEDDGSPTCRTDLTGLVPLATDGGAS